MKYKMFGRKWAAGACHRFTDALRGVMGESSSAPAGRDAWPFWRILQSGQRRENISTMGQVIVA